MEGDQQWRAETSEPPTSGRRRRRCCGKRAPRASSPALSQIDPDVVATSGSFRAQPRHVVERLAHLGRRAARCHASCLSCAAIDMSSSSPRTCGRGSVWLNRTERELFLEPGFEPGIDALCLVVGRRCLSPRRATGSIDSAATTKAVAAWVNITCRLVLSSRRRRPPDQPQLFRPVRRARRACPAGGIVVRLQ